AIRAHGKTIAASEGVFTDLPGGARPAACRRNGDGARVVGRTATAVVAARGLNADLSAVRARPPTCRYLGNAARVVGGSAGAGVPARGLDASLSARTRPPTRWRRRNCAGVVRVDALARVSA